MLVAQVELWGFDRWRQVISFNVTLLSLLIQSIIFILHTSLVCKKNLIMAVLNMQHH